MIAVDTSAIIAILFEAPDALAFEQCLVADESCMSAVSLQEASMVLAGRARGAAAWEALDALLQTVGIEIVPHDADLALLARDAFLRFGEGRHPAQLNFGDCASYGLARHRRLPLSFKGNDFAHTDITAALPAG
jgi:ribonuclease VapC